ncbi:50S ribosomal protein L6 [Candidatus Woesearchaeota archaeon]|nr:50S ribosomal protein L6 [Candidatus Woesearchaeota archaeon]
MRKRIVVEIEIPEGVTLNREGNQFTIKGEYGVVRRKFYVPGIIIELHENKLIITSKKVSKREKTIIHTFRAHFNNAFKGVQHGYTYKLRICSGHFPMNVSFNNNLLSISNFLGEKVPRTVKINPEVKVKIDGREITLEGSDKEMVAQAAADIEQRTRRPGFDKRIFQDGIYVVQKAGKEI